VDRARQHAEGLSVEEEVFVSDGEVRHGLSLSRCKLFAVYRDRN
jgi:hypothetical protein